MVDKRQHGDGRSWRESTTYTEIATTPTVAPTPPGIFPTFPGPGQNSAGETGIVNASTTNTDTAVSQTGVSTNVIASSTTIISSTPNVNPVIATNPPVGASPSDKDTNLSNGAVAGVAIGALTLGALVAFLASFFLFKRRKRALDHARYNSGGYSESSPELVALQKSYVRVSQTPLPVPIRAPSSTGMALGTGLLPPSAHESEVQTRLSSMFKAMERHIDTFYRDVHASITPSMHTSLVRFGRGVDMASLLQDCSHATAVLKHALAAYMVQLTDPTDGDLFPNILGTASGAGNESKLSEAKNLHRRLSVFLYNSSTPHATSTSDSPTREAAEHFSLTFFPWANPLSSDQEKDDDLMRIISETLDIRIWLYGQTGSYNFRWDGVGTRGVVVRPEVIATQDGNERVVLESNVLGI